MTTEGPEDPFLTILLGEPWAGHTLPPGMSAGWHWPFDVVLSTDDPGPTVVAAHRSRRKRVGLVQHGPLVVLLVDTGFGGFDCPRPWLVGEDPPDVEAFGGDHVLWKMFLVQRGIVADIAAFTTSPTFTRHLRRIFAEMRARGPMSIPEADAAIEAWREAAPDEKAAWKRALVTSRAGD